MAMKTYKVKATLPFDPVTGKKGTTSKVFTVKASNEAQAREMVERRIADERTKTKVVN